MSKISKASMKRQPVKVMQFICPTGYYGAERWITALVGNTDPTVITQSLVVTDESEKDTLKLCDAIEDLGLLVHTIPMKHKFDVGAIWRLKKIIETERIDILHTHGYKSDIIGLIAARLAGIQCICTPHGFENTKDIKLRLFIALGNFSFRFFHYVVPLSNTLCSDVAKMGVPADRIKYIANGVDLKDIDRRKITRGSSHNDSSGLENRPIRTLGFIGQLISRKNIDDILDVFEALCVEDDSLRLVLIGDGDQKAALENRVSKSLYSEKIAFRGFVADAIPCYYGIDIFLMTSSLEGIPRCLMEAMATRVPVVAYDIPGVDQLVFHEKTGLLAPFGDKATLKTLCERLLNDSGFASLLTSSARTYIEEHHSAGRMALEYSEFYKKILNDL